MKRFDTRRSKSLSDSIANRVVSGPASVLAQNIGCQSVMERRTGGEYATAAVKMRLYGETGVCRRL